MTVSGNDSGPYNVTFPVGKFMNNSFDLLSLNKVNSQVRNPAQGYFIANWLGTCGHSLH